MHESIVVSNPPRYRILRFASYLSTYTKQQCISRHGHKDQQESQTTKQWMQGSQTYEAWSGHDD